MKGKDGREFTSYKINNIEVPLNSQYSSSRLTNQVRVEMTGAIIVIVLSLYFLASLPTISASAGGGPPLRFIVQLIDQYGAPTACRPSVPWQIELVPESRLNEADDPAADGGADSAADSAADGAVTGSQSPEAGERGVYALQPIVRECDEASGGNGSGADGASAGNRSLQRANVDLRCAGALRVHLSADAGTVLGPIVALLDVAPGRAHAANCVLEGRAASGQ